MKLFRVVSAIFIIASIGLGTGLYLINHELQSTREVVSNLESDKSALESTVQVLQSNLADRDSTIEDQSNTLTEQSSMIEEQTLIIQARDSTISTLETNLSTAKSETAFVKATLRTTEANLQSTEDTLLETSETLQLYRDTWGSVVTFGSEYDRYWSSFTEIPMVNNSTAADVTFSEVKTFLLHDRTNRTRYIPDVYACGEFARDLHNNAEKAGIRAAVVALRFNGDSPNHAVNAFMTTDQGLVFIDCTGTTDGSGPFNSERQVEIKLGGNYLPHFIWPDGWTIVNDYTTTITDVNVFW